MRNKTLKKKTNLPLVIISIFLLLVISCMIITFSKDKNIKIKAIIDKTFEEEKINQRDKLEVYLIFPEKYANEEIDNYVEELGNKFNYSLMTIEFKYNHVIYQYKKIY